MNTIITALTIVALSICGAAKTTITENQIVIKPTKVGKQKVVIYKKVPTKWVKITKKSN